GDALQEEDPLDDLLGMLHLADGMHADGVMEAVVAPVLAHLAVDEVLVDGGQLGGEDVVENLDDFLVALHGGQEYHPVAASGLRVQPWQGLAAHAAIMSRSISSQ